MSQTLKHAEAELKKHYTYGKQATVYDKINVLNNNMRAKM